MKKLLLIFVALLASLSAWADVEINESNFPDAYFRNWLLEQDYGSDGVLTDEEIISIIYIDVNTQNISNLTGIEHFTALQTLVCSYNDLEEIDVSNNTELKRLDCRVNSLTALDVSNNTALTQLECSTNQLTSLDVSHNTALKYLECNGNQLNTLDVSQNTALTRLGYSFNCIQELDLSYNIALTELCCISNQLDTLDVSHNTALTELECGVNQLTTLDVSHNTALTKLQCQENKLTALDVSQNTALTNLECIENQINGVNMEALVASLPTVDVANNWGRYGEFRVINLDFEAEQNVITTSQVTTARDKNWTVYCLTNNDWEEYDGNKLLINSENFPDDNFRNWLLVQDYGSDGVLTDGEIAGITVIDVSEIGTYDLTGIEHFTALTDLDCHTNPLNTLDVSHNTALITLDCGGNQLEALDVSNNTALTSLGCGNNKLDILDVRHNTALTSLECYNNLLNTLDVSYNTALTELKCQINQLTALDVSQNTALKYLGCNNNQLDTLDVSQNTALITLDCSNNQLKALDVSNNTALVGLNCSINQINGVNMEALVASLPTVDVENNFDWNGEFRVINLDSEAEQNVITTSQVTTAKGKNWTVYGYKNHRWEEYDGSALPINSENFPDENFRNWLLEQDYGSDGVLTDEEIAGITEIDVRSKNIANLTGIEHFTALTSLGCSSNQLNALDLSHNTALTMLICYLNQIDTLDVSHNTALLDLDCSGNQLTALDVSHNTALTELYCSSNQLPALDVSHNTALKYLECNGNQLTALDVSHNTALTELDCYGNQLETLDLSHNTALTKLWCHINQLTALDVSHNTALTKLQCQENKLKALDVSHNTALTNLNCSNNQINGRNMKALVASLPTVDVDNNWGRHGEFRVINLDSGAEQNVITTSQVLTARGKNWTVLGYTNYSWNEYDGSYPVVSYIDENREVQSHEAIDLMGDETSLGAEGQESWYVACDTLNYTQTLTIAGDVHLILADGAVMNIGTEAAPISGRGIDGREYSETTLTIYGQTLDDDTAGHLNINSGNCCIDIDGDYAQHGGNVTANSSDGSGVAPWYNFAFTGGTLYITADKNAIYNDENVDILGGKLSAVSVGKYYGIFSYNGVVTFGWKSLDDEFTVSNFTYASARSDIKIVDGQAFSDGENIYDSTTPKETFLAMTNVTLRPVVKLEGVQFADNHYATWYGDQNLAVPEGLEAYVVTNVVDYKAVVEPVSYIPAGVGVLLYSETSCENIYTGKYHGTTATVTSLLTGSLESQTVNDGYLLYNDSFVRAQSGTTIAPHRCYLPVENPSSAPSLLRIVNPNVTTGIEDLTVPASGNGQRYNLMGQPVGPDYRGIVIQNGKKILVK